MLGPKTLLCSEEKTNVFRRAVLSPSIKQGLGVPVYPKSLLLLHQWTHREIGKPGCGASSGTQFQIRVLSAVVRLVPCVNTPKALRAGATPQLGTHRRQKPHAVAQDSQEVCPDELADQLKHVQILSGMSGVVVGVP